MSSKLKDMESGINRAILWFCISILINFSHGKQDCEGVRRVPVKVQLPSVPLVESSPGVKPGGVIAGERVCIPGLKRFQNLKKYAHSRRVRVQYSEGLSKSYPKIELCLHRNATLGLVQCRQHEWKSLEKGLWTGVMSPYETIFIDIRMPDTLFGSLTFSVEEEFQQYRLVFLGVALLMLFLAPILSKWVPFYYSSAMAFGVIVVILIIIFQVAETRFASHTIVLRRLVKVKEALKHMVISAQWGIWKNSNTARAINVRRMILDEDWWGLVNYVLEITDPIMAMLRFADSDQPCLGDIYDSMDSMLEKIKMAIQSRENDPEDTLYKKVEKIVHHRWNKMTTPLHLLAYALSPRYYSAEVLDLPGRVPPFRDAEVADGYKKALAKIFQDPEIGAIVRSEFAAFNSGEDFLPIAIADQSRMSAIKWWYLHGQAFMYLQPLAIKVLSQGMKMLPTGRKSSLYLLLYGSVVGLGSVILHYISGLVHSVLQEFGFGEELINPVAGILLLCVVLAGAGLGYWGVRKLVLSEDGAVDRGTSLFVAFAIRIVAATMIFESSCDSLLSLLMVIVGAFITFWTHILEYFLHMQPTFFHSKERDKSFRSKKHSSRWANNPYMNSHQAQFLSRLPKEDADLLKSQTALKWGSYNPQIAGSSLPERKNTPSPVSYTSGSSVAASFKTSSPLSHMAGSSMVRHTNTPSSYSDFDEQEYYSTFHETPVRKHFTKEGWEDFTKLSTRKALRELASSPEFTEWTLNNADRIMLSPAGSKKDSYYTDSDSKDSTEEEHSSGGGWFW